MRTNKINVAKQSESSSECLRMNSHNRLWRKPEADRQDTLGHRILVVAWSFGNDYDSGGWYSSFRRGMFAETSPFVFVAVVFPVRL